MESPQELFNSIQLIEKKLGYTFRDPSLLILALTHRSFVNESREVREHNERLEFLGDSVMGLLIAEHLYRHFPTTPEGELSYLRARLVEASSCVNYIRKLEVGSFILLGKGERMNDGRGRESILSDLFEAILGAIYIDGGLEASRLFLMKNFSKEIEATIKKPERNWKAALQDYCQKRYHKAPVYEVVKESGPDHSKQFHIRVFVEGQEMAVGEGGSKKEAQQAAAEKALMQLQLDIPK